MNICKKLILLLVMGVFLFACQQKQNEKTANLVYVNWAEGIAYTHLVKAVLEDMMGYEVNLTSADVAPAYASVAKGSQDAFMETWLPVLHKDYIEKYKDNLVDLGVIYEGTQSGLIVPKYVSINKISQLNDYADKFNKQIVGIDAGAGIMKTTEKVIKDYNLSLELLESSGPAMTTALKKAIDKGDWIVITGWKPHWMFGRWDLKFLQQDEDKKVWGIGKIHLMGRKNLAKDKPELAKFLGNIKLTDEKLSSLMLDINNNSNKDIMQVVREWIEKNKPYIESWIVK